MKKSHLLINEQSLQVLPSLATALGLEEAIVIQQLHYWLNNPKNDGRIDDHGNKWIYNTYEEWQEGNFPFWSVDKIQRIFLSLKKQGVIIIRQLDAKRRDMRNFYRIDYDKLCTMDDSVLRPSNTSNLHDVKMNQRLPENTTQIAADAVSEIVQSANKKVDAILEYEKEFREHAKWQGRENVPPHLLQYADWWNSQTGQVMRGGKGNNEWLKAFTQWQKEELTVFDLQEAYNHTIAWKKIISRPSEITSTAAAIHALPKPTETQQSPKIKDGSGYV